MCTRKPKIGHAWLFFLVISWTNDYQSDIIIKAILFNIIGCIYVC
jgi:hypothetical protein